jgi:signal transduction histidine kinase
VALATGSSPQPDLGRRLLVRRVVVAFFSTTLLVALLVALVIALVAGLPTSRGQFLGLLLLAAVVVSVLSLALFVLQADQLTKPLFLELKRLEDVRRDFVANVSHELKTPLTASRGMVETMIDDPQMPDETRRLFLFKVRDQVERLSALVSDLLALSRIEGDSKSLAISDVDLRGVLEESLNTFWSGLRAKDLEIRRHIPATPAVVRGDKESLAVAIGNLLDNAIKYSPRAATIDIGIEVEDDVVTFSVEDEGIGISPNHQERIFERFYRVDAARSRALGGTGLGLSIVKHIALAHGGNVGVESAPGQGSRFSLILPLQRESAPVNQPDNQSV